MKLPKIRVEIYSNDMSSPQNCLHCHANMVDIDDGYLTCFHCRHSFDDLQMTDFTIMGFYEGFYRQQRLDKKRIRESGSWRELAEWLEPGKWLESGELLEIKTERLTRESEE